MTNQSVAPSSTSWMTVFTFHDKLKMYNRDFYSPQLTHGRASTQEVDQVLSQIEAIKNPIHFKILISSIIWMGTIILMFVGLFLHLLFNDPQAKSDAIPIGVLVFMAVMLLGLLRNCTLHRRIQRECKHAMESEVNPRFASRGLRWVFAEDHPYWIELHNDFLRQGTDAHQQMVPQPYGAYNGFSNQNTGGQLNLQIHQGAPQYNTNVYMPPAQH